MSESNMPTGSSILWAFLLWLPALLLEAGLVVGYLYGVELAGGRMAMVGIFLLATVWGFLCLFLPFMMYASLRKDGLEKTLKGQAKDTYLLRFPMMLGGFLVYSLWIFVVIGSLRLFMPVFPFESIVYMFASLGFVAEFFKMQERLGLVENLQNVEIEPYSRQQLKRFAILQSPLYLGTMAFGLFTVGLVGKGLVDAYAYIEWVELIIFVLIFVVLIGLRFGEKWLEKEFRRKTNIPWNSRY
ncbi:MAG: hypothetical protein AAFR61_19460 [Bacteroidota bacterium]